MNITREQILKCLQSFNGLGVNHNLIVKTLASEITAKFVWDFSQLKSEIDAEIQSLLNDGWIEIIGKTFSGADVVAQNGKDGENVYVIVKVKPIIISNWPYHGKNLRIAVKSTKRVEVTEVESCITAIFERSADENYHAVFAQRIGNQYFVGINGGVIYEALCLMGDLEEDPKTPGNPTIEESHPLY